MLALPDAVKQATQYSIDEGYVFGIGLLMTGDGDDTCPGGLLAVQLALRECDAGQSKGVSCKNEIVEVHCWPPVVVLPAGYPQR